MNRVSADEVMFADNQNKITYKILILLELIYMCIYMNNCNRYSAAL